MAVERSDPFAHRILRWFDAHARALPWRVPPGQAIPADDPAWPYRVWMSEIMLQQTTVTAVKPYFEGFLKRWPTVTDLANAEDGDVMAAWAGLGYYARARNLLACARAVRDGHQGRFPDTEDALRALPGIGAYTAAAIAAIAFGRRAVVVDGNVERVIARHNAVEMPMPAAKPVLRALTDGVTPDDRAGDFAQAMMDLGATRCTPRKPACGICPVHADCKGRTDAEAFPVKPAKKARPERHGIAWWVEEDGVVLLIRRPESGMLGGMLALPSDDWDKSSGLDLPLICSGRVKAVITHIFTHFSLTLEVRDASISKDSLIKAGSMKGCTLPPGAQWWPINSLDEAGLPTLFAKAVRAAVTSEDEEHV